MRGEWESQDRERQAPGLGKDEEWGEKKEINVPLFSLDPGSHLGIRKERGFSGQKAEANRGALPNQGGTCKSGLVRKTN